MFIDCSRSIYATPQPLFIWLEKSGYFSSFLFSPVFHFFENVFGIGPQSKVWLVRAQSLIFLCFNFIQFSALYFSSFPAIEKNTFDAQCQSKGLLDFKCQHLSVTFNELLWLARRAKKFCRWAVNRPSTKKIMMSKCYRPA